MASVINPAHWTQDIRHEHTCRGVKSSPSSPACCSISSLRWDPTGIHFVLQAAVSAAASQATSGSLKATTFPRFIHQNPAFNSFFFPTDVRTPSDTVPRVPGHQRLLLFTPSVVLILSDNRPNAVISPLRTKQTGLIEKKKRKKGHIFHSSCPKTSKWSVRFLVSLPQNETVTTSLCNCRVSLTFNGNAGKIIN